MQVRFTHLFVKQISKVQDKRLAKRIEDAITEVKNANILSDISHFKKLKGYTNAYRKSIGDHRIGLYISNNTVEFACFMSRKEIYRYFP